MEFFFFTFGVCGGIASFKVATPGATECGIFPGSFEASVGVKKKAQHLSASCGSRER